MSRTALFFGTGLVLAGLLLASCGGALPLPPPGGVPPTPELQAATPTPETQAGATAPPAPAEGVSVQQAWQASRHADTFVGGDNNACAACHSPRNWMPTDKSTFPDSCMTCKFEVPPPKPVVKAEWKSIQCETCHRVSDKGEVSAEVVSFDALMAMFGNTPDEAWQPVANTTELCEKCHRDVDAWHYARDLGQSVHVGYACTQCHDAHSNQASCTAAACHPNALNPTEPVAGHDADHAAVSCVACHDAAGLDVGPVEGQELWLPLREGGPGGVAGTVPYLSHNLQRKVDCARCHFTGNQWGLKDGKTY